MESEDGVTLRNSQVGWFFKGGACKNGLLLRNWRGVNFNSLMSWYTIKKRLVINCQIGSALAYKCTFSFVSQKSLLCNILIRLENINSSSMHHFLLKTWRSGIWPFTRAFVVIYFRTIVMSILLSIHTAPEQANKFWSHIWFIVIDCHCLGVFLWKKINYFYPNKAWLCCRRPTISNRA